MKNKELLKISKLFADKYCMNNNGALSYSLIKHKGFAILKGLFLEQSIEKESFYIQFFLQPLYVPSSTLDLSFGERIGQQWNIDSLYANIDVIDSFMNKIPELSTFIDVTNALLNLLIPYYGSIDNKWLFLAYTYLIIESSVNAQFYLEKILTLDNENRWYDDQIKAANNMIKLLENYQYEKIMEILFSWQKQTMKKLKL